MYPSQFWFWFEDFKMQGNLCVTLFTEIFEPLNVERFSSGHEFDIKMKVCTCFRDLNATAINYSQMIKHDYACR